MANSRARCCRRRSMSYLFLREFCDYFDAMMSHQRRNVGRIDAGQNRHVPIPFSNFGLHRISIRRRNSCERAQCAHRYTHTRLRIVLVSLARKLKNIIYFSLPLLFFISFFTFNGTNECLTANFVLFFITFCCCCCSASSFGRITT